MDASDILGVNGSDLHRYPNLDTGRYIQLTVSDTGYGMTEEVKQRLFEPFYTTKRRGKGTGMGLAVVHGIVQNLRGAITVESEEGEGAVFRVLLPEYAGREEKPESEEGQIAAGKETVLVVDDEEGVVNSIRQLLEEYGYTVVATTSSNNALQIFHERCKEIDIVLTDITMPGMTGLDLAKRILTDAPGMPVIMCTGFSDAISLKEAKAMGIRELILKPILGRDLARAIRAALSS